MLKIGDKVFVKPIKRPGTIIKIGYYNIVNIRLDKENGIETKVWGVKKDISRVVLLCA